MSATVDGTTFDAYHVWLGIPAAEQPPNFYRLLGIPTFESNLDVIASAADRQMSHVRSFQTGKLAKQSQELLNEIARAKVNLLHPEKKPLYDEKLKQLQKPPAAASSAPVPTHSPATSKLPMALPLEPRTAPKQKAKSDAKPTAKRPKQRAALPVAAEEQNQQARRSSPIIASAVGGVLAVICVVIWLLARSGADPSPVPEVASADSADPPPLRAEEVNVEAFELAKPQEGPATESSNGPKWQAADSSPLSEVAMGAKAETPSLPDVRTNETAADDATAAPAVAAQPSAQNLPDFDQLAAAKTQTPAIDQVAAVIASKEAGSAVAAKLIKQDIPGTEELKSMRAQLVAAYNPAEAKSPGEQVKLAREMVQAAQTIAAAGERYALLSQAAELAESAGDAALTLQVVDILGESFKVDACQLREQILGRYALAARSTEQYASLVAVSDRAIKQALACNNGLSALRVADNVLQACQRLPGREFRKDALARRAWVESMSQRQQEVQQAEVTVAERPGDGTAHLTLGRWYCFFQDDWKQGLPHLAKCTDEPLSVLALQDAKLADGTDVEAQVALGDAWWDLAQRRKGEEQEPIMLRAGHWYQRALDGSLAGLKRIRLEKRLEELVETRNGYRARLAQNSLETPTEAIWNDATP